MEEKEKYTVLLDEPVSTYPGLEDILKRVMPKIKEDNLKKLREIKINADSSQRAGEIWGRIEEEYSRQNSGRKLSYISNFD